MSVECQVLRASGRCLVTYYNERGQCCDDAAQGAIRLYPE